MLTLEVDRDSVHPGDDLQSHAVSLSVSMDTNVLELIEKAMEKCILASIASGEATWIVYAGDEREVCLGVLAQQWSKPKLLIHSETKVNAIFPSKAGKLLFRYWCQSDPLEVLKALELNKELPSKYR